MVASPLFLSEAYLESSFCMTELHGIWTRCERDEARFVDRIRVHLSGIFPPATPRVCWLYVTTGFGSYKNLTRYHRQKPRHGCEQR